MQRSPWHLLSTFHHLSDQHASGHVILQTASEAGPLQLDFEDEDSLGALKEF